ncbi:hypothetical protein BKA62DRAFT_677925 [Auriculariales sp. MPI-PUGE-AT-0066]|nr:hypothetical protein BKA62DRAFT_677925 [Auriculariales sp. MPI-PUGE-AT-0066]
MSEPSQSAMSEPSLKQLGKHKADDAAGSKTKKRVRLDTEIDGQDTPLDADRTPLCDNTPATNVPPSNSKKTDGVVKTTAQRMKGRIPKKKCTGRKPAPKKPKPAQTISPEHGESMLSTALELAREKVKSDQIRLAQTRADKALKQKQIELLTMQALQAHSVAHVANALAQVAPKLTMTSNKVRQWIEEKYYSGITRRSKSTMEAALNGMLCFTWQMLDNVVNMIHAVVPGTPEAIDHAYDEANTQCTDV